MKKNNQIKSSLLITLCFLLFNNINLFSQPEYKPPKIPDESQITNLVNDLSKELNLSKEQQGEIQNLYTAHLSELKTTMDKKRKEHEIEKEKMDSRREEFEMKIKNLLSEDQKSKFDKFIKEQKLHHGSEKRNHHH